MSNDQNKHPAQRCEIERWLAKRGADFTFEVRSIGDFDIPKSLKNQARIGMPLDKDVVNTYRLMMDRGDVFPAVIAYWDGRSLVLIGGNHRLASHSERGDQKIPTYVVKAEPELIIALTFEDNVRNGKQTSVEEREFQAIYLLDRMSATAGYAASVTGLSENQVKGAWERHKADNRARKVGLGKEWNSLPKSARGRLGSIRTDEGFIALSKVAIAANLTVPEINDIVTAINQHRSSREQEQFVTEQAARLRPRIQAQGGPRGTINRGTTTAFERFLKLLTAMERISATEIARTARLKGVDLENLERRVGKVAEKLLDTMTALVQEDKNRGAA